MLIIMPNELRTEVHFRSVAFNTSEPKDYFINDCCFGDDLCRWLIKELRSRGFRTADEPGQEDFGWYFTFHVADTQHCFVLGYQPGTNTEGLWRGWLERRVGFLRSILGGRKREIGPEAAKAIHGVLSCASQIRDVSWHFAHAPDDDHGTQEPTV